MSLRQSPSNQSAERRGDRYRNVSPYLYGRPHGARAGFVRGRTVVDRILVPEQLGGLGPPLPLGLIGARAWRGAAQVERVAVARECVLRNGPVQQLIRTGGPRGVQAGRPRQDRCSAVEEYEARGKD